MWTVFRVSTGTTHFKDMFSLYRIMFNLNTYYTVIPIFFRYIVVVVVILSHLYYR